MSDNQCAIGDRLIGRSHPPFIIAEVSGNHGGSLERALQIVDAAAEAGAHAVKLQTYTADTMTLDIGEGEFCVHDPESLWSGKTLYDLYNEAHTPWEWHSSIFDRCRHHDMVFFSTPFDSTAVDFLETLQVPCYKVASFENTDIQLIRRIAATGKPIILSTGLATAAELDQSVRVAREGGCNNLVLLKCTSAYPASPADCNLRTIPHLAELFDCQVGLSDHTAGIGVAVASVALGATVIEKHITMSRTDGAVDSAFSIEPQELHSLVTETHRAWEALGNVHYGPTPSERPSLQYRRSLYVARDIAQGESFSDDNVRSIRPGLGLPIKDFDAIRGKVASRDLRRGTPMAWDFIL